jgi:hypothetical protein
MTTDSLGSVAASYGVIGCGCRSMIMRLHACHVHDLSSESHSALGRVGVNRGTAELVTAHCFVPRHSRMSCAHERMLPQAMKILCWCDTGVSRECQKVKDEERPCNCFSERAT